MQRSLDNIHSHAVRELSGGQDFHTGTIRLEASHVTAENMSERQQMSFLCIMAWIVEEV